MTPENSEDVSFDHVTLCDVMEGGTHGLNQAL